MTEPMDPPRAKRCETCGAWSRGMRGGQCRRRAPRVTPSVVAEMRMALSGTGSAIQQNWPQTGAHTWCSEWLPKVEETGKKTGPPREG